MSYKLLTQVAAVKAWLDGKEIQFRDHGSWWKITPACFWKEIRFPSWLKADNEFRLAPTPTTRPWSKPEDVPAGAMWLRHKNWATGECKMIIGIWISGLTTPYTIQNNDAAERWEVVADYEWSDASRKEWHPCTVEEAK